MEIYGPQGLRKFLRTTLDLSWSYLEFDFVVHELKILDSQIPQTSKVNFYLLNVFLGFNLLHEYFFIGI